MSQNAKTGVTTSGMMIGAQLGPSMTIFWPGAVPPPWSGRYRVPGTSYGAAIWAKAVAAACWWPHKENL
jgi:hypothetical protein